MTVVDTPLEAEPQSAGQVVRRRWRAGRIILFTLGALMLLSLFLAALKPRVHSDYLDPQSPGPDGTRALAQLIGQRGSDVQLSRSADDAAQRLQSAGQGALLVLVRSDRLTGEDLGVLQSAPGDRLLVDPTQAALAQLAPGVQTATTSAFPGVLSPGCQQVPAIAAGGEVGFGPGATYVVSSGLACFKDGSTARLAQVKAEGGARTVTVVGSGDPLTNTHLAEHGNAALGLNLTGGYRTVVWLLPDLPKPGSGAGDRTFSDLIPQGVRLAELQLLITVLLVAAWRMRRFGPIVAEKLPVAVRSAEAVEGRARLYRSRRARDRAADALRVGALNRMVPRLGLPRSAAQDPTAMVEIVQAVKGRTGWDETTIAWCLYGPAPVDDLELVRLSDLLDELEKQALGNTPGDMREGKRS